MPRLVFLSVIATLAMLSVAAVAANTERDAALRGVDFLRTAQEPDGGFGGFGPGQTFDAVYAIRAAGLNPTTFTTGGNSPADFLRANIEEVAASPGLAGKGALAALALGLDPRDIGGVDLVEAALANYDVESGALAGDAFNHALATLGIVCTGNDAPGGVVEFIRATQLGDGGWGFADDGDPDTIAIVLQALLAAGAATDDEAVANAVAFLRATQAADAGWGFDPAESNANSTAYVMQALIAAGEDLTSADYQVDGVGPLDFLLSLQQEDGSFPGFDPVFATNQAIPALVGRTYCATPVTPLEDIEATPTPEPEPTPPAEPTAAPTEAAPTPTLVAPGPPATGTGTVGGVSSGVLLAGLAALVAGVAFLGATQRAS
jgi:prenyltransferase beta subunit